MKKSKTKQAKIKLWVAGIAAGLVVVGAIIFKIVMIMRDPDVLGTTTVSVTVTCDTVCTDLIDELINDQSGQPILPNSSGEFDINDTNVTINTTVKGTAQLVVTLTNSAYPAPLGFELFNQLFSSGDAAYDAIGQMFEILPSSGLSSYLQLGQNILDIYVKSAIHSPAQDIHRQIIINYVLPDRPDPRIIDYKLTNNSGNSLPYVNGVTDQVAKDSDLPLHVKLNADNANRIQLLVTDNNGNVSIIYDGVPLPIDSGTGYATYLVDAANNGVPGLHVGRNIIKLIVTGLNGRTISVEWIVHYWPEGVEPPNTGVLRIGGLTFAITDLLLSTGVLLLFVTIVTVIILKKRNDQKNGQKKTESKKKTGRIKITFI
ncbi:hypothetical protein FWC31_03310 [Candidatus Saccharibacteria bacterium]|nr:hypothetical protein [Candidatus Saccharibacteria bacterium]